MNGRQEDGDGGDYGRRMASGVGTFAFGNKNKERSATGLGNTYKKFAAAPRSQEDENLQSRLKELAETRPSQDARLEPPERSALQKQQQQQHRPPQDNLEPSRPRPSEQTRISATHSKGVLMSIKDFPEFSQDTLDFGPAETKTAEAKMSSSSSWSFIFRAC